MCIPKIETVYMEKIGVNEGGNRDITGRHIVIGTLHNKHLAYLEELFFKDYLHTHTNKIIASFPSIKQLPKSLFLCNQLFVYLSYKTVFFKIFLIIHYANSEKLRGPFQFIDPNMNEFPHV